MKEKEESRRTIFTRAIAFAVASAIRRQVLLLLRLLLTLRLTVTLLLLLLAIDLVLGEEDAVAVEVTVVAGRGGCWVDRSVLLVAARVCIVTALVSLPRCVAVVVAVAV